MTSIPLTCPACNGTGEEDTGIGAMPCSTCSGAWAGQLPSLPLNVREVSGCDDCRFSGSDEGIWSCEMETPPREWRPKGGEPNVAPDWCPLRKEPVTLRLKEGA